MRMRRAQFVDATILVDHHAGMDKAVVETPLDGNLLILGDKRRIGSVWADIDERAAGAVSDDELVAEDLRHVALDRDQRIVGHRAYCNRGQEGLALISVREFHGDGAGNGSDQKHAHQSRPAKHLTAQSAPGRLLRRGVSVSIAGRVDIVLVRHLRFLSWVVDGAF